MLDCAKERTNSTLHCLKDKLDNLEGLVNNNSVVARSLTSTHTSVDSETSLNNELGRGSSDRYPQHDTSPVKIISSKYRPVRRISKPTQEVQQPPRTSVPSCTFASKPHHQTCPERTEQPKQGHTVAGFSTSTDVWCQQLSLVVPCVGSHSMRGQAASSEWQTQ
ncbi:uncharacterized protein LOC119739404 isoform X1 [Patiria miniata]|uniref:Uncharacterized protein n=1 Tax=Patiria miniata TaxID=46514 RepID=A0A914B393_PATMI|nr:uncharacterized protein LOC119739404 isoform X1 [Patiria miniata]